MGTNRQADDLEITPEMIEAGAEALDSAVSDLAEGWITSSEISARIYELMERARTSSKEVSNESPKQNNSSRRCDAGHEDKD